MEKTILVNYLKRKNPNIYWIRAVDDYLTGVLSFENFLSNIKSKVWTIKDEPLSSSNHNEYINYYTKLIMNENLTDKKVGIIYTELNEYKRLKDEYIERLQALEVVLKLKNINYKICSDNFDLFDILIPLTSFAIFSEEIMNIDKNKLLYLDNNNYFIIKSSNINIQKIKEVYDIIHIIDIFITYNIITHYAYNYITIINNN